MQREHHATTICDASKRGTWLWLRRLRLDLNCCAHAYPHKITLGAHSQILWSPKNFFVGSRYAQDLDLESAKHKGALHRRWNFNIHILIILVLSSKIPTVNATNYIAPQTILDGACNALDSFIKPQPAASEVRWSVLEACSGVSKYVGFTKVVILIRDVKLHTRTSLGGASWRSILKSLDRTCKAVTPMCFDVYIATVPF